MSMFSYSSLQRVQMPLKSLVNHFMPVYDSSRAVLIDSNIAKTLRH